ncbi:MAG: enoyl-CoA hydratase-related protein, partial [Dehalococcoidia bacterium]|nr:enoyl-CoA hydratase-related protein [Dehalococcoidia bacterium]
VRKVCADDQVRVIVLRGAGRAFCAGGDIPTFAENLDDPAPMVDAILGRLNETVALLSEGPRLCVAGVHGAVVGVGVAIAIQSDFCVAAENAQLMPGYPRVGLSPDGGATAAAVERLGPRRAIQFFLGEDVVDARRAHEMGLVDKVVPETELDTEIAALAQRLARHPPLAIARTKALVRQATRTRLAEQLTAERDAVIAGMETEFFRNAVRNFGGL